jgi:3-oxoacyl-[acyl-carrier protein] reductase
MTYDFFQELIEERIASGSRPERWWDESRIPIHSIDMSVTELMNLRGKRAVVTGGAGLNLGQACVNRLAGLGADVAVVDLDPEVALASGHMRHGTPPDAQAIADAASAKWGTKVVAVHGNTTDWESVQRVMRECNDALGGIDILVNNVADTAVGDFSTYSVEDIDMTIRGTLTGALYCTRTVLDYMIPQGSGRIINIGSEAGVSAQPGIVLYGSMKAGLIGFTRFLGKELGKHNIQVLGVNPGSMWGPNRVVPNDTFNGLYPRGRTAIQRYELPEEVANMVAFLATDAASAMTGEMINMGGGMSL